MQMTSLAVAVNRYLGYRTFLSFEKLSQLTWLLSLGRLHVYKLCVVIFLE